MSKMYGKQRVVLSSKPTHLGNYIIAICGSESGQGGTYFPIGYWYEIDGLLYVDLKSYDQFYKSVNRDTIEYKQIGGLRTKKELREFVMTYYQRRERPSERAMRLSEEKK